MREIQITAINILDKTRLWNEEGEFIKIGSQDSRFWEFFGDGKLNLKDETDEDPEKMIQELINLGKSHCRDFRGILIWEDFKYQLHHVARIIGKTAIIHVFSIDSNSAGLQPEIRILE